MSGVMEHLEDGVLWERARAGDAAAFGSLFDRHFDAVYRYCFRRSADWAVAEDLTSVVFLEAWRRRRDVELAEGRALPWLLGVATNAIRNQRRALRRYRGALVRVPPLEPERDFADELTERLAAEQQMGRVLAAVRGLPKGEQDVVALCVWEGLSGAEAAEALDVPEATVRTRLFRARARLRSLAETSVDPAELSAPTGVTTP